MTLQKQVDIHKMLITIGLVIIAFAVLWWLTSPDPEMVKYGKLMPGPSSYPIVGNIFNYPFLGADAFEQQGKMILKYGNVIRLWIGSKLAVSLFNAEDVEVILKNPRLLDKGFIYRNMQPWLGEGLLLSTGTKWKLRRKAITPTFHFKTLENFHKVFQRNGNILVEQLMSRVDKGSFDVTPYVTKYTLDVICETAMGTKINAQISEESIEYQKAVVDICQLTSQRMNSPLLQNDFLYYLSGVKSKEDKLIKVLHDHTKQVIQKKEEEFVKNKSYEQLVDDDSGIKGKSAFLELLLNLKWNSEPAFTTEEDIREEVDMFMFEGHDTTTSTLCYSLDWLAAYPDYQEKLYDELKVLYSPEKCEPTIEEINDLEYLDRFFKEVLRITPSAPAIARDISETVHLPSGYTIPANTLVNINIYHIHRNERWFPNPNVFNPDNFLPEAVAKRHPFAYIPFSAGARNCVGQKFAQLQVKLALIKLVVNFTIEPELGFKPMLSSHLLLHSPNGHRIKISKRPKAA